MLDQVQVLTPPYLRQAHRYVASARRRRSLSLSLLVQVLSTKPSAGIMGISGREPRNILGGSADTLGEQVILMPLPLSLVLCGY
jgi:hypothetical protein